MSDPTVHDSPARYRVARPASIRLRVWDDEAVVYDDRTGDTHLLDPCATRALARLLVSPASVAEIAEGGDEPAAIADRLERLTRARLLARAP